MPQAILLTHQLNEKAIHCPYTQLLRQEVGFDILLRCMINSLQVYLPENTPLPAKIGLKTQEYGQVVSVMIVVLAGQELTLQQAAVNLEAHDSVFREEAYEQINQRRLRAKDTLVFIRHLSKTDTR